MIRDNYCCCSNDFYISDLHYADDNRFNSTNPDIRLVANASEELVMFNKESSQHDFIPDEMNNKSEILNEGQ
jgi:hypothetical protein